MTRSVEDAAILFNILQGSDPLDDRTSGRSAADPIPSLRQGVAGLRLAVLPEGERTGVDQEMLVAYDNSVEVLRGLGAQIDQSRTPAVFTRMVNLLDLCALSLPNGFTAAGLPTSLQIVCRGYDEGLALRIGWAYEHAVDWLTRLPPMF
jgi:Asp-tRNA(Asn)/Glu-tRNA(Gln) amidotransferase A subunit family amidase